MSRSLCATIVAVCIACTTGCSNNKSWVYAPNPRLQRDPICTKTAAVLPFSDSRPNSNKNRLLIYMIPLVPGFGWANYEVPEGQNMHMGSGMWVNYNPREDFAKALADELRNARVFKEAYFDFKRGTADLVVTGRIASTKYTASMISYGLSVYGPLLWFFGFPAGHVANELSVELTCVDPESNEAIFSQTYDAPRYKKIAWIYVIPNDFNYPPMLKEVYGRFTRDLEQKLKGQP